MKKGEVILKYNNIYRHGGDIYRNKIKYDFSVNTNPLGIPENVKIKLAGNIDLFENYPDLYCENLKHAISEKENIAYDRIFCGNGASEIFKLIVDAVKPKKALVTAPSFSGYEYALGMLNLNEQSSLIQNIKIEYYYLKEDNEFELKEDIIDYIGSECDIVFICNPCNPTGRCTDKKILLKLLDYCEKNHIYLVIDECFLGFLSEYEQFSMKHETDRNYLIVVNAFTKLYAMAGLRLGYCFCGNSEIFQSMLRKQPEWSVSIPAQLAGAWALEEDEYVRKSQYLIKVQRKKIAEKLKNMGIKVFHSDANFLLIKSEKNLYDKLLDKGILIRKCADFKGLGNKYYRIAVKTEEENNVLLAEMLNLYDVK